MAEEQGSFAFGDVVQAINEKLIRRHPHVFGDKGGMSTGEVNVQWDQIKAQEKEAEKAARARAGKGPALVDSSTGRAGALSGVSPGLPALARALKLQQKASKVGFDWNSAQAVIDKIREETGEIEAELLNGDSEKLKGEVGDLLFVVVNLARHLDVDPETALRTCNLKVERRFAAIEDGLAAVGKRPEDATLAEMDALWDAAKAKEKASKTTHPGSRAASAAILRVPRCGYLRMSPERSNKPLDQDHRTAHYSISGRFQPHLAIREEAHGKRFRRHPAGMDRRIRPVQIPSSPTQLRTCLRCPCTTIWPTSTSCSASRRCAGPSSAGGPFWLTRHPGAFKCSRRIFPGSATPTRDGSTRSSVPQQGVYHPHLGTLNIEVTVTGNRGWVDEKAPKDANVAADLTTLGQIWFSPGAHQNSLVKFLWTLFANNGLPFPSSKANSIKVTLHNSQNKTLSILPARSGETTRFKSPEFARHPKEAWAVANLEVGIGPIVKTGNSTVDEFNQLVMDAFNVASGNLLTPGNILTWNVWRDEPSLVDQEEWSGPRGEVAKVDR